MGKEKRRETMDEMEEEKRREYKELEWRKRKEGRLWMIMEIKRQLLTIH